VVIDPSLFVTYVGAPPEEVGVLVDSKTKS